MGFLTAQPSAQFSNLIKHYWSLESCLAPGQFHSQRIVPSGLPELIFYLDERPEASDERKSVNESTVVSGQQKEFYDLKITGNLSLFSILFQPHALALFFDIPASEFFNRTVPLRYILKDETQKLEEELAGASSFSERIKITEQFFADRLHKNNKKYELARIENSIRLINDSRGIVSVDYLASEACLSRKQFERTFSSFIGISPKQFLKIIRFQNAVHEKSKDGKLNLTELTYKCGYYDQSHMSNDFFKISGMTPSQYFADCEPYSDYFQ